MDKTGGYIELVLRIRIFHMEPDPELFVPRPGSSKNKRADKLKFPI